MGVFSALSCCKTSPEYGDRVEDSLSPVFPSPYSLSPYFLSPSFSEFP